MKTFFFNFPYIEFYDKYTLSKALSLIYGTYIPHMENTVQKFKINVKTTRKLYHLHDDTEYQIYKILVQVMDFLIKGVFLLTMTEPFLQLYDIPISNSI
jgi:hypothetical protein